MLVLNAKSRSEWELYRNEFLSQRRIIIWDYFKKRKGTDQLDHGFRYPGSFLTGIAWMSSSFLRVCEKLNQTFAEKLKISAVYFIRNLKNCQDPPNQGLDSRWSRPFGWSMLVSNASKLVIHIFQWQLTIN